MLTPLGTGRWRRQAQGINFVVCELFWRAYDPRCESIITVQKYSINGKMCAADKACRPYLPLPKKLSVKDNRMSDIDCTFRFCPKCQTETKRKPSGACRPCNAQRTAKYRAANPEKVKAGIDAWRLENKTKANASSTAWAVANPEKLRASSAAWKKANRKAVRVTVQNRRAMIRGAGGSHTVRDIAELMSLQKSKCACCKCDIKKKHHVDHIEALVNGGSNDRLNLQLLCPTCNQQKHAKHPIDFMQEKGFLL